MTHILCQENLAHKLHLADEEDALILADERPPLPERKPVAEEALSPFITPSPETWKVLIADDEQEVHEVTHLALQGFTFNGKPLTFLSAYSAREAREIFASHSDIALVLLDVVMEKNDSGLELVKYIRETLGNQLTRIVLRTGQPGEAPEEAIIVDYAINDYKLKTELTQRKLFVTLVSSLRSYHDLMALEINRQFSREILESVPVGVVVYRADGTMQYANQRASQLLGEHGRAKATAENSPFCLAGTQTPYPGNRLPVALALQGQRASADDIEIRHPARTIPVEAWATPLHDSYHGQTRAIMALQDITERRQAEADKIRLVQAQEARNAALQYSREIEVKNAELIRLNQEKNEFLGIASHDLKNPLSGILGLAEMITSEGVEAFSTAEIAEYVRDIQTSAEHMFALITNLLDVNKIESGKFDILMRPADLSGLACKIAGTYQTRAAAKKICLECQPPTTPLMARVDELLVSQVLDNLISNALKYSFSEKTVQIRFSQSNGKSRCEIQDHGPGLSEKDCQKLFGKFARLSARPTGGEHSTGLGLFIVKKLVTAMNGTVWCESTPGQGATFIVEFDGV